MAAVGEERYDESSESDSEHDEQELNEVEGPKGEHPWPYLKAMFEFEGVKKKNADTDKKTYIFQCLLCLPKKNYISVFNNSTSNLKKHVYVS